MSGGPSSARLATTSRYLDILGEAVRRYNWVVYAYVLMTNHTHLVIEAPEETLSRGMQWLNGKYAQWFNRKYKRSVHLFHVSS